MSCPCPTPQPCPQVCPPSPPPPPCLVKPVMRRLHWSQTKMNLYKMLLLCTLAGSSVFTFIGCPRKAAYKEYYARAEFEEFADEMARKGLFKGVPMDSLRDK